MSNVTKIEWADSTFNPWLGCTKVGPGCDHCYAEKHNTRFGGGTSPNWGAGAPRRRTSAANWKLPIKWNAAGLVCVACALPASGGDCPCGQVGAVGDMRRRRVFCASLADVFDNEVDPQWRADLFALIQATPNLDWLLLTKRIGNAHLMIGEALIRNANGTDLLPSWPWSNVWLGATIVNQAEADRDIPKLLATPAAVRFLSMEPLLGAVNLTEVDAQDRPLPNGMVNRWWLDSLTGRKNNKNPIFHGALITNHIDWVIAGGESGPNARPSHPDWFRSLRDQCEGAGEEFMFKQWGEWVSVSEVAGAGDHHHFDDGATVRRIGKKLAGRTLNGVTHDGFPTP